MLRTGLAALVATLAAAPAADAASSPATYLSGRTFHCWQPVGSEAIASRGRVAFATDYVHSYLRDGRQGTFTPTATGVRFTSGPFFRPGQGERFIGDVRPGGVTMVHHRRSGDRYQLVLRSTGAGSRAGAAWYCAVVS